MKLMRYYFVIFFFTAGITILIYNFWYLKYDVLKYEKKVIDYANKYSYIKNNILNTKETLYEVKKKSILMKELQNVNTNKFVPINIDLANIIKELEQFHNEKNIQLHSIRLISTGEEDFNIGILKFVKYRITVLFNESNIDSDIINKYITEYIKEYDNIFSFYYIENFNLTSKMLEYDIKFYFKNN